MTLTGDESESPTKRPRHALCTQPALVAARVPAEAAAAAPASAHPSEPPRDEEGDDEDLKPLPMVHSGCSDLLESAVHLR